MKKTLIINDVAPPVVQGGAIMLGKYLEHFPVDSFSILTAKTGKEKIVDNQRALKGKYFFPDKQSYNGLNPIIYNISVLCDVLFISLKGLWIVKKEKIDNILALSNRGAYLVSAFFIAKLMHRNFFIFFTDAYEQLPRYKIEKVMQRLLEKPMLKSAEKLFVLNEFLAGHYSQKYRIRPEVLPVPIETKLDTVPTAAMSAQENRTTKKIVFTGMVYWAQMEAIKNLTDVVNSLNDGRVKLFIYTASAPEELRKQGIRGGNIKICFAPRKELGDICKQADILFLPLSFNVPYPLLIKTASTTKLPEYLAAGRPILVHAPRDSFVSYYAEKEGFGYVVCDNSPGQLKEAVLRLLEDRVLQENLVKNALRTVYNHDARRLSKRLSKYLLNN
ncbi:MAG: glycosyltransferase [Candidatus Omnitrophota bacterium]